MKHKADQLYDRIEEALLHHRLSNWQDTDGDPYPLVDHLTGPGNSIQEGYDEIRWICDSIYNEVLVPFFDENMDKMRAQFEEWHAKHFVEPLTRSKGGSDYKNTAVIHRWEAWQAARLAK